jgi:hypothetical protein
MASLAYVHTTYLPSLDTLLTSTIFSADDILKSSAYLAPFFKDTTKAATPFNLAYNTTMGEWDWIEQPGNEWRFVRFTQLLGSASMFYGPDIFLQGEILAHR